MGLLRGLFRLPLYLLQMVYWLVGLLLKTLLFILRPFIGRVEWQPPAWLGLVQRGLLALGGWCGRHIKPIALLCLTGILVAGGGFYFLQWQKNQPKPIDLTPVVYQTLSVRLIEPAIANFNRAQTFPTNLTLRFSGDAAPIEATADTVVNGATLSPAVAGEWKWQNPATLIFVPKDHWPLGQNFKVSLDADRLLAPQQKIDQTSLSFTSQRFRVSFARAEFYQDPVDPLQKSAIFTVTFNAPVDVASFEKRLKLQLESGEGKQINVAPYKFSVSYNEYKTQAWIRSEPIALPEVGSRMVLQIGKGVASTIGGESSENDVQQLVNVPGLYTLTYNAAIRLATVDDNDQQTLIVDSSDGLRDKDLQPRVKAWLLPEKDVRSGAISADDQQVPFNWSSYSLDEGVIKQSERLALTLNDSEQEYQSIQSFKMDAPPGRYIYVVIDSGLVSAGGYTTKTPAHFILQVPDYPKTLNFMSDGAILSMKGERQISVVARNIKGLQLKIKRVVPNQLHHFVALNYQGYANMKFGRLGAEHFTEYFTYQQALPSSEPGEKQYHGIDLTPYLNKDPQGQRGVFLLELAPWEPKVAVADADGDEYYEDEYDDYDDYNIRSRLLVVTDLGIIAKRAQDSSSDVFIQSIQSGLPVAGAKVSVLGKNGITLFSEVTGEDGHVHFPSLSDFDRERLPTLYLVEKDGDLSFLPAPSYNYDRSLNFSRFDIGGVANSTDPGQLTGYLFSDRGVYRPGDTFNIGLIVRSDDWLANLDGMPLEAEIRDPRDRTIKTLPIQLDRNGFNELSYTLSENAPTGGWPIYLYLSAGQGKNAYRTFIGSTMVNVKEFEPDRMKVNVKLLPTPQSGWVKPDNLKAQVLVENLFGTPAQDRRVTASLTLRPMTPYFAQYSDYQFYEDRSVRERFEIELEERDTDENGLADVDLLLQEYAGASYQLQLVVEAFEPGSGRAVAATAQALVSPHDFMIGAKSDGDLNYINRNSERSLNIIALNPALEKISLDGLNIVLLERKYISVLTRQDSGVYKYQSKLVERDAGQYPFSILANGSDFKLPTDKPGDFVLLIKDAEGQTLLRNSFSVAGNANIQRSLDRNAELTLKLSKAEYAPGEDIEVAINAPYTGSGLITIERDKVYHWQWFTSNTTSSVQKIRLPEGLEGNAYINVQFVRDPDSDEVFMSPLSYGVVPLKISLAARRASLEVSAPELLKPGQMLPISVTTQGKQRVVVFAVDEGILQVARYRLSDPLNSFFRKRELSVDSAQILDLILPEFSKLMSLNAAPGGDGSEELDMHLNPFKRKRDKPVTYWSGIIDVDGQTTLNYQVPDYFNGKLRIMAVSVTPDRIGTAQTQTTVRDDFILTPSAPYTVAPGDEFEVTVSVANNLTGLNGSAIPISMTLTTTPQLEVVGEKTQTLSLAEKREGSLTYRLRASGELGGAEVYFNASYMNNGVENNSQRAAGISVRPIVPYRVETTMGRMAGQQQDVDGLRQMFSNYTQNQAKVAYSPLVMVSGLSTYLANYPHYCSEQIVSRALPVLILSRRPELLNQRQMPTENDPLDELYATLRSRQNSNGAIGVWRASPDAGGFVTLYTVHYLLEAKASGQQVPANLLNDANRYLRQFAANDSINSLVGLRQRAYAIYLLTRQGEVTTSLLAAVERSLTTHYAAEFPGDLSAVYLASAYKLLKMDSKANALLDTPWRSLSRAYDKAWWTQDYYDPLVQNTSLLYLITQHFPEKVKDIPPQAIENIAVALHNNRFTTLSAAMSILALDSYATSMQTAAENGLTISAGEQSALRLISTLNGIAASGQFLPTDKMLRFDNPLSLPAWYVVSQTGFDLKAPATAIKDGLEIVRQYVDEEGKPVSQVAVGQTVNVILKVRTLSRDSVNSIAIVDLLPGGFDTVQQTLPPPATDGQDSADGQSGAWLSVVQSSGKGGSFDYADVREDRVLIYGNAGRDIREFRYQIRATHAGTYAIPPAYAEAMYDRAVQAVSPGEGLLVVKAK